MGFFLYSSSVVTYHPDFRTRERCSRFDWSSQVFWLDGVYVAVGTLFVAFLLLMLSQLVLGFLEEYRKKKQFTDLFGQYVPPELVKKMAEDPERYSMAGRPRMTVLFSDVRGFTSISEQLARLSSQSSLTCT